MLAVLVDPEIPMESGKLERLCALLNEGRPDFIFVGGSTGTQIEDTVQALKQRTIPVVLFPGNINQFTPSADALLMLSLLSGRNAELLIGAQVKAARRIFESRIETLSVGYILVDGGRPSSVQLASTPSH